MGASSSLGALEAKVSLSSMGRGVCPVPFVFFQVPVDGEIQSLFQGG